MVAKLLYVSIRGRLDIIFPIAFLRTRAACSTEHDWTKLKGVLDYLNGTIDECLTLGAADDMGKRKTWFDASYAVHKDIRGTPYLDSKIHNRCK